MQRLPATPARIVDPTTSRATAPISKSMLSHEERDAIRLQVFTAGHVLCVLFILLGTAATLGIIKITTGIPIDRAAEVGSVHAAVVRIALEQTADTEDTSMVCLALEGRADPQRSLLDALAELDTLVVPASICEDGIFRNVARKKWMTIRHIDWQWGGRAIVTTASDRARAYYLKRRRSGWKLVAIRPA